MAEVRGRPSAAHGVLLVAGVGAAATILLLSRRSSAAPATPQPAAPAPATPDPPAPTTNSQAPTGYPPRPPAQKKNGAPRFPAQHAPTAAQQGTGWSELAADLGPILGGFLQQRANDRSPRYRDRSSTTLDQWEGRLFRAQGTSAVYVIEGGLKRWIPDEVTLNASYGGKSQVTDVASSFLDQFPRGTDVPAVAAPAPAPTPTVQWEGRLLRADGKGNVYRIEGGRKRWVTTEAILTSQYGGWGQVMDVPAATLDQFPVGADITAAAVTKAPTTAYEGKLLRAEGQGAVYLIQSGLKHWVSTEDILTARYGGWNNVTDVPAAVLNLFPKGGDITTAQGTKTLSQYEGQLFRADGKGPVYLIDGGRKRWISSEAALNQLYGGWSQVTDVTADFLSQFPLGADIAVPHTKEDGSGDDQIHGGV